MIDRQPRTSSSLSGDLRRRVGISQARALRRRQAGGSGQQQGKGQGLAQSQLPVGREGKQSAAAGSCSLTHQLSQEQRNGRDVWGGGDRRRS